MRVVLVGFSDIPVEIEELPFIFVGDLSDLHLKERLFLIGQTVEKSGVVLVSWEKALTVEELYLLHWAYTKNTPIFTVGRHLSELETRYFATLDEALHHLYTRYDFIVGGDE